VRRGGGARKTKEPFKIAGLRADLSNKKLKYSIKDGPKIPYISISIGITAFPDSVSCPAFN
jgi:hypothetical protein